MKAALRIGFAAIAMLGTWLAGVHAADRGAVLPKIGHVFIVVLENEGYGITFGPNSPAPYLSKTLPGQGALLSQYYATGHFSLDNYIAMISGQAVNPETQADCQTYSDFTAAGTTPDGQALGHGCVYPSGIQTIANQLQSAGLTWKAYMEDMGNDPQRESASCGHPKLGERDNTQRAEAPGATAPQGDQYAARHDPFVYFHAIIDTPACANVVSLAALKQDLQSVATTPNYVFITPNLCHDGHDGGGAKKCVTGETGGLDSADRFLRDLVPKILASPAYQKDGLVIVTFDEADMEIAFDQATNRLTLRGGDASACCGEQPGPNLGAGPQIFGNPDQGSGVAGPGGGRTGAVLLSRFIKPGTVSDTAYNHFAMLKTLEDIFGLPPLGFAGQKDLKGFGPDVFTNPGG